jgi:hypothetical protein
MFQLCFSRCAGLAASLRPRFGAGRGAWHRHRPKRSASPRAKSQTTRRAFTTVLEMWGRWSSLISLGLWGPIANAVCSLLKTFVQIFLVWKSLVLAAAGRVARRAANAPVDCHREAKGPWASPGSLTPPPAASHPCAAHGPPCHCKRVPTASCALPHARGNGER